MNSRRDFLRSAAVAAAVTGLSPAPTWADDKAASPKKQAPAIRLGVASYSFREFDRARVIEFMKQIKTPCLNAKDVKNHLPMSPPEATRQAVTDYHAAGIQLTSAGVIYFLKDEDEDMRQKFEYCKTAGVSLIVASPSSEALPRLEKFARQYDMRIAIHNHGPEDKLWPSPLDVLKAVKNMDPRIGCCIDVGHTARTGTDVVAAIKEVGTRLFDVHMKDLTDFHSKESQVAVGDGIMPVRGIFSALTAIRYPGYVDLEYEVHGDDPMPGMIKSFAYMRGVMAGMA